jgi:hypothetical protein
MCSLKMSNLRLKHVCVWCAIKHLFQVIEINGTFCCGLLPQGGFTSSNQAVHGYFSVPVRYGPFQGQHDMDLPSSQSARSIGPCPSGCLDHHWQCTQRITQLHLQRISFDSKILTDRPGSDPAGRPLIHPRNQHDPTGSKPSTAGRPEWPAGLAAEAIPFYVHCVWNVVFKCKFTDYCSNHHLIHISMQILDRFQWHRAIFRKVSDDLCKLCHFIVILYRPWGIIAYLLLYSSN